MILPEYTRFRFSVCSFLMGLIISAGTSVSAQVPVPVFEKPDVITSQDGHAQLAWTLAREKEQLWQFELVYAEDSAFSHPINLYQGPDLARYLSGMPNGSRYYRIRAIHPETNQRSEWSDPVEVRVKHQSLTLALSLAGLGAVVFVLTATVVIVGSRRVRLHRGAT